MAATPDFLTGQQILWRRLVINVKKRQTSRSIATHNKCL